ncbi:MAG TPA: arsinothricin resistance N-acetyltransferase ArsN1 family B [Vicinamibacterales bacterium]|jgi:phosphinothricin acetyltransferase
MKIRLAQAADAAAVAAIYRPFCEGTAVSFEVVAPDADEMAARIATVTQQYPWLVLERDGTIAGYAYATKHRERAAYRWAVDTAVYVHAAARRTGVGRVLYEQLFALLVEQGYFRACAGIALPNEASVALHTAVGFTPVGTYHKVGYKLGAWHDVAWFERPLQPERHDPPPPRAVHAVLHVL